MHTDLRTATSRATAASRATPVLGLGYSTKANLKIGQFDWRPDQLNAIRWSGDRQRFRPWAACRRIDMSAAEYLQCGRNPVARSFPGNGVSVQWIASVDHLLRATICATKGAGIQHRLRLTFEQPDRINL
jgi:hypothetical protein